MPVFVTPAQLLRSLWTRLKERVSALDELEMAVTRLRVRLPGEVVPSSGTNVLERSEVTVYLFGVH